MVKIMEVEDDLKSERICFITEMHKLNLFESGCDTPLPNPVKLFLKCNLECDQRGNLLHSKRTMEEKS